MSGQQVCLQADGSYDIKRHHHHHHQNAIITNECNTGFALINQFDPALNPIRMFVMIALSALVGEAIRFRTNITFEKIAPILPACNVWMTGLVVLKTFPLREYD